MYATLFSWTQVEHYFDISFIPKQLAHNIKFHEKNHLGTWQFDLTHSVPLQPRQFFHIQLGSHD